MPYCSKHNRDMLPSKFGKGEFWCPDCNDERKKAKGLAGGNVVEEIIRKVIGEELAGIKDSLKIMNDSLANIAIAVNKLLKK